MTAPAALIPVAPFCVVRLGALGITCGAFTKAGAERFAGSYGRPTSNFITPVVSPDEAEKQMAGWLARNTAVPTDQEETHLNG